MGEPVSCLGCNMIETSPATLISGTVVCTSCEDWRHECEARFVLDMPTVVRRREYLQKVEKTRGFQSANELRDVMKALWDAGYRGK